MAATIVAAIIAIAVVAVAVASPGSSSPEDRFAGAARQAAKDHTPFDLAAFGKGDWQRVYAIPGYANRRSAERALEFSWPEADDVLSQRENAYVLVFVGGRKVLSTTTVGAPAACLDRPQGFARSTRFAARTVEDSALVYVPGQPDTTDC